jgi:hypothetical protein
MFTDRKRQILSRAVQYETNTNSVATKYSLRYKQPKTKIEAGPVLSRAIQKVPRYFD